MRRLLAQTHVLFHDIDLNFLIQKAILKVLVVDQTDVHRVNKYMIIKIYKPIEAIGNTHHMLNPNTGSSTLLLRLARGLDAMLKQAPDHPHISWVMGYQRVVWVFHVVDTAHQDNHPHQKYTPGKSHQYMSLLMIMIS